MLWHWSRHTLPVSVRGAGLFFCCGFCCCGSIVFRVAFFSELALYGRILLHFRTPKEGYRGGPHMRSLISIDFPAPEMEPESAHVVSAVYVP